MAIINLFVPSWYCNWEFISLRMNSSVFCSAFSNPQLTMQEKITVSNKAWKTCQLLKVVPLVSSQEYFLNESAQHLIYMHNIMLWWLNWFQCLVCYFYLYRHFNIGRLSRIGQIIICLSVLDRILILVHPYLYLSVGVYLNCFLLLFFSSLWLWFKTCASSDLLLSQELCLFLWSFNS